VLVEVLVEVLFVQMMMLHSKITDDPALLLLLDKR